MPKQPPKDKKPGQNPPGQKKLMIYLTDTQVKWLAGKLAGTTSNVYTLTKQVFRCEFREEDWPRLEQLTGLRRCENCDTFKDVKAGYDKEEQTFCSECMSKIDGASDQDE